MKTNQGKKNRIDSMGNIIGNGDYHAGYTVFDFSDYPQISAKTALSETTESVYITYRNDDNSRRITVRFSNHINNATIFGDQLNGLTVSKDEVLYHLGLKERTFVPDTYLSIAKRCVAKKDIESGMYSFADVSIKDMYALGKGADLSPYKGKIAKDSNYLILGDKVEEFIKTSMNWLGFEVQIGHYLYS